MTAFLRTFFESTYRPEIQCRMTHGRVNIYTRAVELLDKFAGGGLQLQHVDEPLLSAFILRGSKRHGAKHRRELAGCIRTIVRAWRPAALCPARGRSDPAPAPAAGSVRDYFEAVYAPQVLYQATSQACDDYRLGVRSLADHYGHDVLLREQTDALAADHFRWLLDSGLRPATVNTRYRATWFAVWRHAARAGLVRYEPKVRRLREHLEEPDAWSPQQFAAILEAAASFRPGIRYGAIPCALFWPAVLLVNYWTGLRRRPLLAIRQADVALETGWLHVPGNHSKNRRGKRYRLGPDAIAAVGRIWDPPRELLFDCRLKDPNTLGDHLKLILGAAGIPPSCRAASTNLFHKIRRTTATAAAVAGGEAAAAALLGHSGAAVTRRYIDPTQLAGNDATQILPAVGWEFAAGPQNYEHELKHPSST